MQMESDAVKVMQIIDEIDGVLPFNDKARRRQSGESLT